MPRPGFFLNVVLHTARFPDGIAPASPIHAEPVIPFNARLRFELKFSQWRAAVGLRRAFDFPENVQFSHRHSSFGFGPMLNKGSAYYSFFVFVCY